MSTDESRPEAPHGPRRPGARRRARAAAPPAAPPSGPSLRRAVVVLGMHRSGTSALAGVLGLAGAGLPEQLMAASPANPRGYFESQTLYELHEAMLAEAGSAWDDLTPLPLDWFRSGWAERWTERLAKAVQEEFGDAPLFVLKDPRICRLVPLWARVLQRLRIAPAWVISVRNPLEVVASLQRAHQTDERKGALLWLDHVLRAERDTRDEPRAIVSYEALLADPEGALRRLSAQLDLPLARLSRRVGAEIEAFLSRTLRHERVEPEALRQREDVVSWIEQVHQWMLRAADGEIQGSEPLDRVASAFLAAEQAFGPLLAAAERERKGQAEEAAALSRAVDEWREEVRRRDEQLAQLGEGLRVAQAQLDEALREAQAQGALAADEAERVRQESQVLRERLAHASAELASAHERAATRGQEIARLDREAARLRVQLQIATERVVSREQRVAGLEAELEAVRTGAAGLEAQLAAAGDARDEAQARVAGLEQARADASEAQWRARAEIADRTLYIDLLKARLEAIERSWTWRASRPARALARAAGAVLEP